MELWFSEQHSPNVKLSIRIEKQLCNIRSDYQQIDVFESNEFGRFLTLDGYLRLTQKDEFIYHEMITHVPMAVHPHISKVLIIGGGDGGVVRELVKYEMIEQIDVVEIDDVVVAVCAEYFPQISNAMSDERVTLYYEDGLRFLRSKQEEYELIIVDSTDPFGPSEGLFTKEF